MKRKTIFTALSILLMLVGLVACDRQEKNDLMSPSVTITNVGDLHNQTALIMLEMLRSDPMITSEELIDAAYAQLPKDKKSPEALASIKLLLNVFPRNQSEVSSSMISLDLLEQYPFSDYQKAELTKLATSLIKINLDDKSSTTTLAKFSYTTDPLLAATVDISNHSCELWSQPDKRPMSQDGQTLLADTLWGAIGYIAGGGFGAGLIGGLASTYVHEATECLGCVSYGPNLPCCP